MADAPDPARLAAADPGPLASNEPGRPWRLGVMGGTFDPIHHGHLVAGSEVQARFGLDEVVFVPTGTPWQKKDRKVAPAEDRYLMTVIATASNPKFTVSRVDIERGGDTYTVDTLRDLHAQRGPSTEIFFITGADALASILTWHGADELFELAHFIGCSRPGVRLEEHDISHLPEDKVTLVEVPALAISSTACRERVAAGLPLWYLVPDGIVQHINKRGLYRGGPLFPPVPHPDAAGAAPQTQPQPAASRIKETHAGN
jgi:nicotinate-nucleotide adenylyltransferase